MTGNRMIILHYHLFKNAGTSVEAVLKRNFADRWVSREFPSNGGNNTDLVEAWIRDTPDAIAFSSHTMLGPIPKIDGVEVTSLMLLRDPVERIRSAYRFERVQQADTWGAQLAKTHDFEGYVSARLARPGDRQCRNFQAFRLASLVPGEGHERDRAIAALSRITVVERMEAFDKSMHRLAGAISATYPEFKPDSAWENRSGQVGDEFEPRLLADLTQANSLDYEIIGMIRGI